LAVPTLDNFKIKPGLLDFGSRDGLSHTLDGCNGSIADYTNGKLARSDRGAIEMNGACATLRDTATKLGAHHPKNIA
jgi:hypothetical protein